MNLLKQTHKFKKWLKKLRDNRAKARIMMRIKRAQNGNFGDSAPVGEGVSEMRIDYGPGYRVYYMQHKEKVYLLLSGGDKSTQQEDINKAIQMAKEIRGNHE
ncbi:type II toxin-antitoxin system RelE/ParE family toxin [Desulfovibrio sp. JC022]|uniref:type II toxin-antitoxin system RelE/ParE family toxin n=1 Tax=Desulfovibrio sp. JC022 TaxID=2593642 RepID=UPI0013CF9AB4|nr:type II toxin-antitoxin system RelE/ParE family toxin [Desulfovibrio sp. JC022]NDV21687.1 type II toxin-antitoxin system RelE/ParE family toxin [Desulfovibrio sp. JC022]